MMMHDDTFARIEKTNDRVAGNGAATLCQGYHHTLSAFDNKGCFLDLVIIFKPDRRMYVFLGKLFGNQERHFIA